VGKLRRLKDLALGLFFDGRAYHAMAQGWAASGGGCPLPLLWRVRVFFEDSSNREANADLLASLLLPSVRVFHLDCYLKYSRVAVLVACAVRRAGYKHTLQVFTKGRESADVCRVIAPCTLNLVMFELQKHVVSVWGGWDDLD
jgi:hypothetical protein